VCDLISSLQIEGERHSDEHGAAGFETDDGQLRLSEDNAVKLLNQFHLDWAACYETSEGAEPLALLPWPVDLPNPDAVLVHGILCCASGYGDKGANMGMIRQVISNVLVWAPCGSHIKLAFPSNVNGGSNGPRMQANLQGSGVGDSLKMSYSYHDGTDTSAQASSAWSKVRRTTRARLAAPTTVTVLRLPSLWCSSASHDTPRPLTPQHPDRRHA
jgi:hypothetical protein